MTRLAPRALAPSCRPFLLAATLALLSGCGHSLPDNAETRLRSTLDDMQKAAESRDIGALMGYVAADYTDTLDRNRQELRHIARFYFMRHRKPHVLLRIKRIDWLDPEHTRARVDALVATAGQAIDDPGGLSSIRADLIRFDLLFEDSKDGFRLHSAHWQHATPADFL